MSKQNLRDFLSEFYGSRPLSDRKARRLVGLAQQPEIGEARPVPPHANLWRPAAFGAMGVSVALLVLVVALYMRLEEAAPGRAPQPAVPAGHTEAVADPASAGLVMLKPDLVAVEIHADWCARTPDVAPIFDNLASKYGDRRILFVRLDITDETGRQQARYLTANLGIGSVYDEPFESGMVKLIDRQDGQVLAVLTGEEHRPTMEGALAQALGPGE